MSKIKVPRIIKRLSRPIELGFKYITYPIVSSFFNNKEFIGKLSPESIKRVLIIRHDYLGDMVVSLPMFAYIKAINPNIEIDVFCSKSNFFILSNDRNISNIIVKKDSVVKIISQLLGLRKNKYDLIINTQYLKVTKNGWIVNLASSKNTMKTMVWASDRYKIFFNKLSKFANNYDCMWEKLLYLVYDTIETNIDPNSISPYLAIDDKSRIDAENNLYNLGVRDFFCVNISARQAQNRWTKEGYIEFLKLVLDKYIDLDIVIFSIKEDQEMADSIINTIQSNRIKQYPQTNNVLEISAAISKAKIALSLDTGFLHLLSAMKVPLIGLYGGYGTNTTIWRPYKVNYVQLEGQLDEHVKYIKPKRVLDAFDTLYENLNTPNFGILIKN